MKKKFIFLSILLMSFSRDYLKNDPLKLSNWNPNKYKKIRNYNKEIAFFNSLKNFDKEIINIKHNNEYPFYKLSSKNKDNIDNKIKVLLLSGVHGDEPAAHQGLNQFLTKIDKNHEDYSNFYFTVLPLINIWGWEHDSRYSYEGYDLNRSMYNKEAKESQIISDLFNNDPLKYDISIDLHEAWSQGFFVYIDINAENSLEEMNLLIDNLKENNYAIDNNYAYKAINGIILNPKISLKEREELKKMEIFEYIEDLNKTTKFYTFESSKNKVYNDRAAAQELALEFILKQVN